MEGDAVEILDQEREVQPLNCVWVNGLGEQMRDVDGFGHLLLDIKF